MVLVFYILDNYVSILHTKFSDREGHEARRVGLEAVPLDQHIEGGHGERQARLKIRPAPMHHLLQMQTSVSIESTVSTSMRSCHSPRGHTLRLLGRPPRHGSRCPQDNHPPINLLNQPLKGVIRDIGGGTRPPHDQPPLIQQQTQFPSDNPPVIREAFAADLLRAAAFAMGWINSMP